MQQGENTGCGFSDNLIIRKNYTIAINQLRVIIIIQHSIRGFLGRQGTLKGINDPDE
jgi:hypothetical protein